MLYVWLTDIFIVIVFICLIGIQSWGRFHVILARRFFYTGLFNTRGHLQNFQLQRWLS